MFRTPKSRRTGAIGISLVTVLFLLWGCGGEDAIHPEDSTGGLESFDIGSGETQIQHQSGTSVVVPGEMFTENTTVSISTTATAELSPLPAGVTPVTKTIRFTVESKNILAHDDTTAVNLLMHFSVPLSQKKSAAMKDLQSAYAQVGVSIPGLDVMTFYGGAFPSEADPDDYMVNVPLSFYRGFGVGLGAVDIEITIVVEEAIYGDPRLFHVDQVSGSQITMSEVNGQIDVPVGKGVVMFVHGWSGAVTSRFNGIDAANKVKAYWGNAVRYFDANGGELPDLYCLYYNEDQDLDSTASRLKAKAADWFSPDDHGKMVVVAHSMGGLLTRAWMNKHQGDQYVSKAVFIDTPHLGSALGSIWMIGAYSPLPIPPSGAQNLIFTSEIELGGISIVVNSYLNSLNSEERHWSDYALAVGQSGTLSWPKVFTQGLFYASHLDHRFESDYITNSDGIVEVASQLPEDLFGEFDVFRHTHWHIPAKDENDVLDYCLNFALEHIQVVEPEPGSISVNPDPNAIGASWTLTGPDGYSLLGTGDQTIEGLDAGTYQICWGIVEGYVAPSPACESQSLSPSGAIAFNVVYGPDEYQPPVACCTVSPESGTTDQVFRFDASCSSGTGSLEYRWDWENDSTWDYPANGAYTTNPIVDKSFDQVTWWNVKVQVKDTSGNTDSKIVPVEVVESPVIMQGFRLIPPASEPMPTSFTMGGNWSDAPPHQVTLTGRFEMASTEVTNAQYLAALQWAYNQGHVTATNESVGDAFDGSTRELVNFNYSQISFSGGAFSTSYPDRPVVGVSWYGAASYCDWRSLQEGLPRAYNHSNWSCNSDNPYSAFGYRLPTEAEWEFACRAGTTTHFNSGNCLDASTDANYDGSHPDTGCPAGPNLGHPANVGSYIANGWGLNDMHGNVSEWCNDWHGDSYENATDPVGAGSGYYRILRGGFWDDQAIGCMSSARDAAEPNSTFSYHGFRPVRSAN